jgi:CcmD family protein
MSDLAWLFIGLVAVWAGIGFYLVSIAVRQRRLEHRLEELVRTRETTLTNAQSRRSEAGS